MLSDDLAKLLTIQHIDFKILPLSSKDFLELSRKDEERGLVGRQPAHFAIVGRTAEMINIGKELIPVSRLQLI